MAVMFCVAASVALFVLVGIRLFASGWQSYEQSYMDGAERTLDAIYLTIPPQHVMYLSLVSFAILALLFTWLTKNFLVGTAFGLIGLGLPKFLLWRLKKARDRKFDHQLVGALANLGNSLKAGFSLPQALDLLAREMPNPMHQEMGLVVREMQVGVSLEDALAHLYERMPSQDLDLIISSILISRDVGGNLTEIFDNIAYTIRERHRIEGKVRALSSQGKLQGFIIMCMPPGIALALSYIAPNMIRPLYTTGIGWALMALIGVLLACGMWMIYKIVAIEI
jgi:tight adherence protein B